MHDPSLQAVRRAAAFESTVLENGLTVRVHTMPGFTGVHAVYGTKFGSIDRAFALDGKRVDLPAGIAHFLEHKMFENEEGDAFTLYARTGASANAYTSFDKTCYIFTASGNVAENLDILLGFVSRPYFTAATVEKEQGIIGQEIKQYDDAPDWRLMFAMYECLYTAHPVRDDIAGSVESIAQITPEILYACTDAFYRPQNMVLAVAGNVTMDEVLAACARADIPVKTGTVERLASAEGPDVAEPYREFSMAGAKPLLGVGFKETPPAGDADHLRHAHGAYLRQHDAAVPQALRRGAGEPGLLGRDTQPAGGAFVPVRRRDAGAGDGARPAAGRDRPFEARGRGRGTVHAVQKPALWRAGAGPGEY